MSKGLGKKYLTTKMQQWHKADLLNRMHLNVEDKKIPMPRYYKDKIYNKEERGQIKAKFTEQYQQQLDKMLNNPVEADVLITQIVNQQKHDKRKIKHDQQKRAN
jgi:ribosomal protein S15P/S13E